MSEKKQEDAPIDVPLALGAYSIPEFCRAHNITPATYFKLKTQGLGPDEMQVGRRVLISVEAAARWRAEREEQRVVEERKRGKS